MFNAKDKVVLITGGAAGIGAGVVEAFLEDGAKHVGVLDVDVKNGESLQSQLSAKYGSGKIKFYKCDITTNDLKEAFDSIRKENEYIDVVVNCAGIMNDAPKVYEKEIAVNVTALITSSLTAYEGMRKDHGGRGGTIINVSSIAGLIRSPLLPVYFATKSAVLQFSNCLGMEPNYSMSGVRVITVCFGVTDTSLIDRNKMSSFDPDLDEPLEKGIRALPLQSPESAVSGLMQSFKDGTGGSTWLITSNRPAEDITNNVDKAYETWSQGVRE